jgi:(+)-trans-carveol dehydrogenase
MPNFEGKTAFVTGAGRGQGRSHAVAFAEAGANVVISDIAKDLPRIGYPMSSPEDLDETRSLIEGAGRKCLSRVVDVRDGAGMAALANDAVEQFGTIDAVSINQGVVNTGPAWELTDEDWDTVVSVNLTGSWRAAKAVMPHMVRQKSGAIVLTSSINGFMSFSNMAHYSASKHGVIGLMRSLAVELAPYNARANVVAPSTVPTNMLDPSLPHFAPPGTENPTYKDIEPVFRKYHLMPTPFVYPQDITAAVLWLASDEARFVTGVALPIDAGALTMPPAYPMGTGMEF